MNRAKVLSARSVMEPASADSAGYERVDAHAKIASFAAAIIDSPKPFAVVDKHGGIVGEIAARSVIDLLSGKERGGTA